MSSDLEQKDLAEKEHWDFVHGQVEAEIEPGWKPTTYELLCLENIFLKEIDRFNPKSVLEVGCGNSVWLPYLAKKRNLRVFGLDYSEEGCELARNLLAVEGVAGTVFCGDLFSPDIEGIGQFDFVYSIGVVEHFSYLENVLSNLLKFVKPGGVLLTEVPNLYSVHGIITFLYQPELFRKHRILKKKELQAAYNNAGLSATECNYAGFFSLGVVSWGIYQRFPALDKIIVPLIKKLQNRINSYLITAKKYNGASAFAPFLYAVGKKPI
jgi:SAM-dependent methyltransferase